MAQIASPGGTISLPTGGGALTGIGETFTANPQTGAATLRVPIALPRGRGGFGPSLTLAYNSGNGQNAFGLGWELGVPSIVRSTRHGVPTYDDDVDTFVLSGAEELVPVPGGATGETRYRPATEGLFARIAHERDGWVVRTRDGTAGRYEEPLADPGDDEHVFAWLLSLSEDPFGNRVEYGYSSDAGPGWTQRYLSEIRYLDYGPAAAPQYLLRVRLVYEQRPDPFSRFRAGFEVRTRLRCTAIETYVGPGATEPSRICHLRYLDQATPPRAAANGTSLLWQVQMEGRDGARTQSLPPLEFGYTRFEPDRRDLAAIAGRRLPAGALDRDDFALADVFGNGLPDVVTSNGAWRVWRNRGGELGEPHELREAPAGLHLDDPDVALLDADGDGRPDLVVGTSARAGYHPLRFGAGFDHRPSRRVARAPSFSFRDPEARAVDLTGDGVSDVIRFGSRLECFFHDPALGWRQARAVARRPLAVFPDVTGSDPRVHVADLAGDGLPGIALVHAGRVDWWPSLGRGRFGARRTLGGLRLPAGYDPRRVLVGDLDGDGAADVAYVGDERVTVWLNQSGNGFSPPRTIHGTPRLASPDGALLSDFAGTGTAGILWTRDPTPTRGERLFFLDLTGGKKPYLLNRVDNHHGAVTEIDYASSTSFYLEDERDAATRWRTTLPFPVQVVARVRVRDALSGATHTTRYRYHHGYWDGADREFRGFARVDRLDADDRPGASPPTELRSWFHVGPVGDARGDWAELDLGDEHWSEDPQALPGSAASAPLLAALPREARRRAVRTLRGSLLRTELYARDGRPESDRPYTVSERTYTVLPLPVGAAWPARPEAWQARVFFPCLSAERTTAWERGDDPMTSLHLTSRYDAYGRPSSRVSVAVPRARDFRHGGPLPAKPYVATQVVTGHCRPVDEPQRYLVQRVASVTTLGFDVAAYERSLGRAVSALELALAIAAGSLPPSETVGETLTFYGGRGFEGLPLGQLGAHGVPVRVEQLVLTAATLAAAYPNGPPPYLAAGTPAWSADYPAAFRAALPESAGYRRRARGLYAVTEQCRYDVQDGAGRGLVLATRDALGHETTLEWDPYQRFVERVTDPLGLVTTAEHDLRAFQPALVTGPNGERRRVTYSPLGLVETVSTLGRAGEDVGDVAAPGIAFSYDFEAFDARREPIGVRTVRRVRHRTQAAVASGEPDETIETREYSDGFGRLLQTRTQADALDFGDAGLRADPARAPASAVGVQAAGVVVSGAKVYDDKGRVIEVHEPYRAPGFGYAPPPSGPSGPSMRREYDARGVAVRTVHPDGSEDRLVQGVPLDLADPDRYRPTAWETCAYDRSDNAGRTHGPAAPHRDTPTSTRLDPLGRVTETVERNGTLPAEWHTMRSNYDLRGNLVRLTDEAGRVALRQVYDLAGRALRRDSIDAGAQEVVLDAAGNEIERRDARGALVLESYDDGLRRTRTWARDRAGQAIVLCERRVYGDESDSGLSPAQAAAANALGRLRRLYDDAGLLRVLAYDFRGNQATVDRSLIRDQLLLSAFAGPPARWQVAPFRVDWEPPPGTSFNAHASSRLDPRRYALTMRYDALGRVVELGYPQAVAGGPQRAGFRYGAGGAIAGVDLDGGRVVRRIAYNARGQRVLIAYGNGVMTRYAYDPSTFRLVRLRSEGYDLTAPATFAGARAVHQDTRYGYDLLGNVTGISERAPGSGVPGSPAGADALERRFAYDALSRLREASGREHDTPLPAPWDPAPRPADVTRTRLYREAYDYDAAGNLIAVRHPSAATRRMVPAAGTNRLARLTVGSAPYAYAYDAAGNLASETSSRHFEWDARNRLRVFREQIAGAEPSRHVQYLRDPDGACVKTLVRRQGGAVEVTVRIANVYEHRYTVVGPRTVENATAYVLDGTIPIAEMRTGPPLGGDTTPRRKYHLPDHLGASTVVLDGGGALVSREEYTPYGETSFGGFARKRFRFSGKERDAESGLYDHGARHYAPWLGRWTSADESLADGPNAYRFVRSNPLKLTDPSGEWGEAGHYYTVYFTALAAGFTEGEAFRTAFYAELPDEIAQLAAKTAGKRWFNPFRVGGSMGRDLVVPLQSGGHALTGGQSSAERAFRYEQSRSLDRGGWELGMSLHPFGDAYSHEQIGGTTMYSPPDGHTRHGHEPDEIAKRKPQYTDYVLGLYRLMNSLTANLRGDKRYPRLSEADLKKFVAAVTAAQTEDAQITVIRGLAKSMMGVDLSPYDPRQTHEETVESFVSKTKLSGLEEGWLDWPTSTSEQVSHVERMRSVFQVMSEQWWEQRRAEPDLTAR